MAPTSDQQYETLHEVPKSSENSTRRTADVVEGEIHELHEKVKFLRRLLSEVNETWEKRAEATEKELQKERQHLMEKEEELELHEFGPRNMVKVYPGPACLEFADGTVFMLIATIVIVVNIALMLLQMVDHDYAVKFYWPNQFFMIFYIVELTLKAFLFQGELLCGPIGLTWWNWLDLVIVCGGVLDMYVKPALSAAGLIKSGSSQVSSILSFLRILRLARIMKVVGIFLKADYSWCESDQFQVFIMGVIGFNCLLMGFEADHPDFFLWPYLEQVLLVIFFFELAVRLKQHKLAFFYASNVIWNWLDFIIVAGAVLDMWAMPTYEFIKLLLGLPPSKKGSLGQIMTMLRMVRILRMLRLVRLVKNIKPLFDLMTGIMLAMQGMAWVLLLTLIVLYIVALICVKLIGHGLVFPNEIPPVAKATFPDISSALFVCFMAMNGDVGHLEDIMEVIPSLRYWVMAFMIVSSWAILSILTAVVSDKMIDASEDSQQGHEEEAAKLRHEVTRAKLEQLFQQMDNHHRGHITRDEFDGLLGDDLLSQEFAEAAQLEKQDLKQLFDYLSEIPNGQTEPVLVHDAFFEGLKIESRTVNERSMMRFEKRINAMHQDFQRCNKKVLDRIVRMEENAVVRDPVLSGSTAAS